MPIDTLRQLRDWEPPYYPVEIIEDGLLLPETSLFLFGPAKSWKTMHTTHLAFCLAQGLPWFDLQTTQSTVLKIQVELPKLQDKNRIEKYTWGNGITSCTNIYFHTPERRLKLDTTYGKQELFRLVEEVRRRRQNKEEPLVIILDPVYKLMAGSVSSEEDVKAMQDNLDEVKKKFNASFIIVHHTRLTKTDDKGSVIDSGAEDIMGSSLWNDDCDTMIRLYRLNPYSGDNRQRIVFVHHRNAQTYHAPFEVRWNRSNLTVEVTERELVEDDEPTIHNLVGG